MGSSGGQGCGVVCVAAVVPLAAAHLAGSHSLQQYKTTAHQNWVSRMPDCILKY